MKQIIQKLGMLVAMLLTFIQASAYDFEVDGIYYKITSMSNLEVGVTHKYDSDRLNYDDNKSYSGSVVIPEQVNYNNRTFTVTSVLSYAMGTRDYYHNTGSDVTMVTMPNTITEIGDYAFARCRQLSQCALSPMIKSIGNYAFGGCAISDVVVPDEITMIGSSAFQGCTQLGRVVIGRNVTTIGTQAFYDCTSLLEVFFTGLVAPAIGSYTFDNVHSGLEKYVPSVATYGFGKEYLSIPNSSYGYSGVSHNIEWTNNLKAYKCDVDEAECKTEVNAGTYTKNLKATYSNGIDLTVEIPYTYTINKAPMSLTVNDIQREYGDQNPAFTCNISGFVNGESEQSIGVTPSFECEANKLSNVGSYRILASLDAPNYEITYKYGTLSILKAPLSLSVKNASRTYGDKNPEFELAYTGLKNGETVPVWNVKPTINTTANQQSRVGEYSVNVSGGDAKNYNITTYTPGTFTIMKRNITAKANDCERLYGEDNPEFKISYVGFVNGDGVSSFSSKPVAECSATKESNAGKYPITVNNGSAENYAFVYQDGTLTVNPQTVGFAEVYNSVTYNDMSISTTDRYFNYLPEISGPFSMDDFWIELWFLDKNNHYGNYVATIPSGDYAGNYVNTNYDRIMGAGKYIFNLTSKGTNPNVVANPSRAYLTVNRASREIEWDAASPIEVPIGQKVDLGISYQGDIWCSYTTDYNEELIKVSSEFEDMNNPHWYATGLKEGETTLYFSIECLINDMGFYNFADTPTLSKRIRVIPYSGVGNVSAEDSDIKAVGASDRIMILNKPDDIVSRVFSVQGALIAETRESDIEGISAGIYLVNVGGKTFKVAVK